jgi:ribosomal protein L7Ae-like RNA K-turn-binding protein
VHWPRTVRVQRQKRVLQERLKVPPAVNQFSLTVDKNKAKAIFSLFDKYKPETKAQKKQRLVNIAKQKSDNPDWTEPKPPHVVKFGINHVTTLVEQKKAKLVLIAHDVDPLEVCFRNAKQTKEHKTPKGGGEARRLSRLSKIFGFFFPKGKKATTETAVDVCVYDPICNC